MSEFDRNEMNGEQLSQDSENVYESEVPQTAPEAQSEETVIPEQPAEQPAYSSAAYSPAQESVPEPEKQVQPEAAPRQEAPRQDTAQNYGSYNYGSSTNYQQYQQNQQQYRQPYQQPYTQPSQGYYSPQTNEYIYSPKPPKKKGGAGKAFLIAIACILSAFVVSVVSISGYLYFSRPFEVEDSDQENKPALNFDDYAFKQESEEEADEEAEEVVSEPKEPVAIRDYPSLEQISAPADAIPLPDIYDKVSRSVVGVSAYVSGGTKNGTGFIISDDGYIVTNAHVIDGYNSVMIVDGDLNEYEAEVIGADTQTDIAVLKIDPDEKDLEPLTLGKSSELRIGELAIAIGNPLSFDLYGTMTTGIISGLNRTVTISDNTMTLLQTSATINPGNSGGPLLDAYGRVIGITSAKVNSTYGEGLGFAIPIDEAVPIIENLIQYGYVLGRPSIGINGYDISEILSLFYRLPQGVCVATVTEGSGADKAGIMPNDIIIGIEGETITSMNEFNSIKNKYAVGDTVTLTIYRFSESDTGSRSGKSFDVDVVLGESVPN